MNDSQSSALSNSGSDGWMKYGGIKFCTTGENQYVAIRPAVYNGPTEVLVFKLEDWKAMLADMPDLLGTRKPSLCPKCGGGFPNSADGGRITCENNHTFKCELFGDMFVVMGVDD